MAIASMEVISILSSDDDRDEYLKDRITCNKYNLIRTENENVKEPGVIYISSDSEEEIYTRKSKPKSAFPQKYLSRTHAITLDDESSSDCNNAAQSSRPRDLSHIAKQSIFESRFRRKRKKNLRLERPMSILPCDDCLHIESSSDDELPDLEPTVNKSSKPACDDFDTSYAYHSSDNGVDECICTLSPAKKIICPGNRDFRMRDHMKLVIRPCDDQLNSLVEPFSSQHSDSYCPRKIDNFRRRISEEKQAGSLPLHQQVVSYSDEFEEEAIAERIPTKDPSGMIDVSDRGKSRISCERQATSQPLSPGLLELSPLNSTAVSSSFEKNCVREELSFSPMLSIKKELDVNHPATQRIEGITYDRLKDPQVADSTKSEYVNEKDNKYIGKDLRSSSFTDCTVLKNKTFHYLERNQMLCLYHITYFPAVHEEQPVNQLSYSHAILLDTLFDLRYTDGLSLLLDLSSKYVPEVETIGKLTESLIQFKEKARDLNFTYNTLLSLLQTNPNLIPLSDNQLRSVLLKHRKRQSQDEPSGFLPIWFMIQIIELDLFTLNLCDSVKIRHSLAHSLLSLEEGKQNMILILHEISMCVSNQASRKVDKRTTTDLGQAEKFQWLSSLHHLIHLGLLTSKNMINSCIVIAKALRPMYENLRTVHNKVIFLKCVKHPLLRIALIFELLENLSISISSQEPYPSLHTILQGFSMAAHSQNFPASHKCEEMIILLYFSMKSAIECQQESVLQSLRTKLLRQGVQSLRISLGEKDELHQFLETTLCHIKRKCNTLTPTLLTFYLYSKCLIDSLDIKDVYR